MSGKGKGKRNRDEDYKPPSRHVKKRTTTPSSTKKKKRASNRQSKTPSPTASPGSPMYVTHNKRCMYLGKGKFKDEINWMKGIGTVKKIKAVDRKIYQQGNRKVCWGWGAGKGSEAANIRAGKKVKPLAIQDIVDRTYPLGMRHGNPAAGLQFIKTHGVCAEEGYEPYTGKQPKTKPPKPRPENADLYKIDDWFAVDDDEEKMLKALKNDVLIVSVYQFDAFRELEGKGLLDMAEAERTHQFVGELVLHTLLLVGAGTFTPNDPNLPPIDYWIVKNQWSTDWGYKGLGYLIRNSSIDILHAPVRATRHTGEILKTKYTPFFAYVSGGEREESAIPKHESKNTKTGFSEDDLIRWITIGTYQKNTLVYLFFDPDYCQENNIDVDEEFTALEKAYYHESGVILAKINLKEHPKAAAKFNFKAGEGVVLLAFLPFHGRSLDYGYKFNGNLNLSEILVWLGVELSAGSGPITLGANLERENLQ